MARGAIRHPAVITLATAGLVFLPGRYVPLAGRDLVDTPGAQEVR